MAEIPACDLDGRVIEPEPGLGDRQGGPVEIRFPAYTQRMILCSECMKQLEQFRTLGERHLAGTLTAKEALDHLPRDE